MAVRHELFDPTDPAILKPEQRHREVATILAAGLIRMREQRSVTVPNVRSCRNSGRSTSPVGLRRSSDMSEIPPESGETRLEVSRSSRPDGPCG